MTTPSYFHTERRRPGRLVYFIAGIFCAFALGVMGPSGAPLILGVILCGALLVAGAPAALGGATWESWIHRGRVHWVRPGRLWGHWESCPVEDVTELRAAHDSAQGVDAHPHRLVLKDGSVRTIDRRCVGDVSAFGEALRRVNPRIQCATAQP